MKTKIKELEESEKEKDNIIQNLKNEIRDLLIENKELKIEYNKINKMNLELKELKEQISKKEKIIKKYELKYLNFLLIFHLEKK